HVVGGVDELQHFGAFQQGFFGLENIGDAIGRKREASDHGLRGGTFGGLFGEASEICGHGIDAVGVKLELQGVSAGHASVGFADDFAQAVFVGQGQVEELHEAGQFGGHFDGGSGEDQSPSVGGEFLAY